MMNTMNPYNATNTRTYINPPPASAGATMSAHHGDSGVFFAKTMPSQGTDRSYGAAPATSLAESQATMINPTYGNAMPEPTNYDFLGHYQPEMGKEFKRRSGRFPYQSVAAPDKTNFFPSGTRVSYSKGRRTYKKTADIIGPPHQTPALNFPNMTQAMQDSANNYGKASVSRRLPERTVRRYHIPGYMGFVKDMQYHHGRSYGRITRECLMQDYL